MRRIACTLVFAAMAPPGLRAQRLERTPAHVTVDAAPNGGWCFGVKLTPRDHWSNFTVLEIGARFRASGSTDHSERDRAHAYPTLENHGDLGLGIVHRQGRVERIPGDGALVKPATATFVGTRVEGGGAVRTTVVAIAILAALEFVIFFGGGGGLRGFKPLPQRRDYCILLSGYTDKDT